MIISAILGLLVGGLFAVFLLSEKTNPYLPSIMAALCCSIVLAIMHFVSIGTTIGEAVFKTFLPIALILILVLALSLITASRK